METRSGDDTPGVPVDTPAGSAAGCSFLKLVPSRQRDAYTAQTKQSYFLAWELYEVSVSGGAIVHTLLDYQILDPTVVQGTVSNPTENPLGAFSLDQWLTIRPIPYDAGDAANTGYIDIFVNSTSGATMRIARFSPKHSIHANSSGLDCTTDVTAGTGSKWHGLVIDGNSYKKDTGWPAALTGSGLDAKAFGGRFVKRASSQSAPPSPDLSDVAVFTRNRVDAFTLNEDQAMTYCTPQAPLTGTGMEAFEVQSTTFSQIITAINASLRNYVFAVDGTNCCIVDLVGNTVWSWPNVSTDSTLRTYAIVATHRGRIWLARRSGAPNQWACSKQADATDFTATTPAETRAYSGSATPEIGVPSDAITCLAPFHDEYMVIGCSRSIYVLTGDPGFGGRIQLIADTTGILGPRAYCFDDVGNMYFMGSGGLYVMKPAVQGAFSFTNLSGRRLADVLDRVDYGTHLVQMAFDGLRSEVHVFITPRDGTQGTHAVLDVRNNALWTDRYAVREDGICPIGPTAVRQIGGKSDEDRRFIMGGFDAFVRRLKVGATSDDGLPIESRLDMPILEENGGASEIIASELQLFGVPGTGGVTWEIRVASSPAQVQALSRDAEGATTTGTAWEENKGFEDPIGLRDCGGALQLSIRQEDASSSWALERAAIQTGAGGRRRLN